VTSQTAHTKYKWLPYAAEWNPPHEKFLRTPLVNNMYYNIPNKKGTTEKRIESISETILNNREPIGLDGRVSDKKVKTSETVQLV